MWNRALSVPHSPNQPRGVQQGFIQPSLTRFTGTTDQTQVTALNKPAQEGNITEENHTQRNIAADLA